MFAKAGLSRRKRYKLDIFNDILGGNAWLNGAVAFKQDGRGSMKLESGQLNNLDICEYGKGCKPLTNTSIIRALNSIMKLFFKIQSSCSLFLDLFYWSLPSRSRSTGLEGRFQHLLYNRSKWTGRCPIQALKIIFRPELKFIYLAPYLLKVGSVVCWMSIKWEWG